MKKAEVVTIPAEKGLPSVEIRGDAGKKSPKATGKAAAKERTGLKTAERMKETLQKPVKIARTVPIGDDWPEEPAEKGTNDEGVKKKSAAKTGKASGGNASEGKNRGGRPSAAGASTGRAKAKKPNEKLTPSSIFAKMLKFGKAYQIESEQDFLEAARIYAEEAGLIDQMRDKIAEDGLTVEKTYKTGSVEVAHPLLSELPRHVESANKCLATIGNMIGERGARVEKAARDLDAFRLHVR